MKEPNKRIGGIFGSICRHRTLLSSCMMEGNTGEKRGFSSVVLEKLVESKPNQMLFVGYDVECARPSFNLVYSVALKWRFEF